jgi:hypothetical protein
VANTDVADVSKTPVSDRNNTAMDDVLPSVRGSSDNAPAANDGFDDDELLRRATEKIREWKAAADPPSLSQVQTLFNELICDGGSTMLRDKVVDAVVKAFGTELGSKRGLTSTWTQIAKEDSAQRAQAARRPADQPAGEGRQQRRKILHNNAHVGIDRPRVCEPPDKQQRAVLGI